MISVETIRRDEYTGENRCLPCTVVNGVLAVLASGMIGFGLRGYLSAVAAFGVGVGSSVLLLGILWLRGYIVPGTPALTKRYMPTWMLRWFGKTPTSNTGGIAVPDDQAPLDVEGLLQRAGAVEVCSHSDDLCLTESFGRRWNDALEAVDEDLDLSNATDVLGFDRTDVDLHHGDGIVIRSGRTIIGQWPSLTALRVDIAGSRVLSSTVPGWQFLSLTQRSRLLAGLRIFLEECPGGGPVKFEEETVESCCASYEVITAVCSDSGDRLFEQPISG